MVPFHRAAWPSGDEGRAEDDTGDPPSAPTRAVAAARSLPERLRRRILLGPDPGSPHVPRDGGRPDGPTDHLRGRAGLRHRPNGSPMGGRWDRRLRSGSFGCGRGPGASARRAGRPPRSLGDPGSPRLPGPAEGRPGRGALGRALVLGLRTGAEGVLPVGPARPRPGRRPGDRPHPLPGASPLGGDPELLDRRVAPPGATSGELAQPGKTVGFPPSPMGSGEDRRRGSGSLSPTLLGDPPASCAERVGPRCPRR
jgi:hypothetical protein